MEQKHRRRRSIFVLGSAIQQQSAEFGGIPDRRELTHAKSCFFSPPLSCFGILLDRPCVLSRHAFVAARGERFGTQCCCALCLAGILLCCHPLVLPAPVAKFIFGIGGRQNQVNHDVHRAVQQHL